MNISRKASSSCNESPPIVLDERVRINLGMREWLALVGVGLIIAGYVIRQDATDRYQTSRLDANTKVILTTAETLKDIVEDLQEIIRLAERTKYLEERQRATEAEVVRLRERHQ